ncbi:hypothetical protein BLNAU_10892 [Blattamonas nauphoetae]|uniref:AIG1-type G domain-containing protein n=1 Tax=Blattamonas nauphoetae TaxID=2049346 RepID=A0ABQ9XRS1_9EUKA|nr:hypothetical protein BLNAU_10892 [Blattamonas nauphoetae]
MTHRRFRILLFGETGAGKSSLSRVLGAPASFRCGVDRLRPVTDAPQSVQLTRNGHSFEIVDTQGISTTVSEDRVALEQTTRFLEKVPHVSLICYVVKMTDNRATAAMHNALRYIRNMFGRTNVWNHLCVVVTHCERGTDLFHTNYELFQNEFKPGLEELIDTDYENERTDPIRFFFVNSKLNKLDPETKLEFDHLIDFASSLNPMPTTGLSIPDPLLLKVTRYEDTKTVSEQTAPRYIKVTHVDGTKTHERDGVVETTVTQRKFLIKREFKDAPDPNKPDLKCIVSEERKPEFTTEEEIYGATMLRKQYCMKTDDRSIRKWTQVTWLSGRVSDEDEEIVELPQNQCEEGREAESDQGISTVEAIAAVAGLGLGTFISLVKLFE